MHLRVGASTDKGRVRSINEDAYLCVLEQGLFVVCDGMGGEAAGEVASQLAIETILGILNGKPDAPAEAGSRRGFLSRTAQLARAVENSNTAIFAEAQKDSGRAGMGTTLVSVWLEENIASVAHVGDSRAYLWHNGNLEALTRDHSLVEEQVRAGLLSRAESLQSQQQNVLLRVLGREPKVEVELSEVPVKPGDYLVLCSDGLTRMVAEGSLGRAVEQLRDPQRICDYLVAEANDNGGVDNITVVVVEVLRESFWRRWWRRLRE
ncbi:MAG: Stp1/IreP family PP2C-type Ser/Thr phosphatase [Acidobacteria bacterium]|nr:Stp1/IreP family PP2C-type Ser/Thr phosphatase [Acidobacteriota bacterium]